MSESLAAILARRPRSAALVFADLVRDAAAAARRGDEAAADRAIAELPLEPLAAYALPQFEEEARAKASVVARGSPASPGAASGRLAFSAGEVLARAARGERVLLVRAETDAGDMEAITRAAGVVTITGGMTSHAAIVARGWGKPCVSGAAGLRLERRRGAVRCGRRVFTSRDRFSIDGATGEVFAGAVAIRAAALSEDMNTVLACADRRADLHVFANADSPADAGLARQLGARGIGLCRTEHMFFEKARLHAMQRMILALAPLPLREGLGEGRRSASKSASIQGCLHKLFGYQKRDFIGLLTAMDGLPVTIRLLDPPLHEFLPHDRAAQAALAESLRISAKIVRDRVAQLRETNPMLGHRGCRLCLTFPEILRMQVRAVVEAMIQCQREGGNPRPRILHALVGAGEELRLLRAVTVEAIEQAKASAGFTGKLDIPIGTMIEVPRAALLADELALHADFFCFGTNDLTQLTFGYSRDDAGAFLPQYLAAGVLASDPFQTLDVVGVGALIEMAVTKARAIKPGLPMSLCGEHGGDPASIRFCQRTGIDAVSCSPFRVPVARLAAAQAAIG